MRGADARAFVLALALAACSRPKPPSVPPPEPPPATTSASPIGDLSALDAKARRRFEPADHFAPIAHAEPGMWLAEHPEPAQTYDDYVLSSPNVPTSDRRTLYILPIGEIGADLPLTIADVEHFMDAFFGLPVQTLPPIAMSDTYATIRQRIGPQALTPEVLEWMSKRVPDDAFAVIAVTMHDLYPQDDWNFVFGQATFRHRVGVFSFARFDDAFGGGVREAGWKPRFVERSIHLLAHEIGHMFGIRHCVHYACLMNGTNSLAESDSQPAYACPVCLRKLDYALGFDVIARERKLLSFYQAHDLTELATWSKTRLAFLEAP